MAEIHYPELGDPGTAGRMYDEGETITHPSGKVYKRTGGDWVLQEEPTS